MRIRWLVRTVESKAYLREYNVVGVRWCMYSCNCTRIYTGKLNTLNKIMSLQWSNNWESNIFNEQHNTPSCLYWYTRRLWMQDFDSLATLCFAAFLPTASAVAWFLFLFMTFTTPNVPSSCWHRVLAAVNLSLPHNTSFLFKRTKVYGYKYNWHIVLCPYCRHGSYM